MSRIFPYGHGSPPLVHLGEKMGRFVYPGAQWRDYYHIVNITRESYAVGSGTGSRTVFDEETETEQGNFVYDPADTEYTLVMLPPRPTYNTFRWETGIGGTDTRYSMGEANARFFVIAPVIIGPFDDPANVDDILVKCVITGRVGSSCSYRSNVVGSDAVSVTPQLFSFAGIPNARVVDDGGTGRVALGEFAPDILSGFRDSADANIYTVSKLTANVTPNLIGMHHLIDVPFTSYDFEYGRSVSPNQWSQQVFTAELEFAVNPNLMIENQDLDSVESAFLTIDGQTSFRLGLGVEIQTPDLASGIATIDDRTFFSGYISAYDGYRRLWKPYGQS